MSAISDTDLVGVRFRDVPSRRSRGILIDPRCDLPYYTAFLAGLAEIGERPRFTRLSGPVGAHLRAEVDGRRLVVDAGDRATLDEAIVGWADVVAKVNMPQSAPDAQTEMHPIGPMFGVRWWTLPAGYLMVARLAAAGAAPATALKAIRFQGITRLPIAYYQPLEAEDDYVFHRSREWGSRHSEADEPRRRFIAALQSLGVAGTASLEHDRIPLAEYIRLTQRSTCVFNSPAVHGCLGWKLGEYLALGKAIVSTRLERALPSPLVHGTHLHFVDDDVDSIRDGLRTVMGDRDYRRSLETGARQWYDSHLRPDALAHRVLGLVRGISAS